MPRHRPRRGRSWKKATLWTLAVLVVLFGLIQLVPYGHDRTNPPATHPFVWSDPKAEAIAVRACYDCHSDQTKYWWGVEIAPFSWLAAHDVSSARARVNFSDWTGALDAAELRHALSDGMPPFYFTLIHPDARLSAAEQAALVKGFESSLAHNTSAPGQTGAQSGGGSQSGGGGQSGGGSQSGALAIIGARCGLCHSSSVAQQFRASSAAEAKALVDNMINQGAQVSPAEEQALIKYFTR